MSTEQAQISNSGNELKFESLSEAVSVAGYVEQVLSAEHQWISNRLSWLFVSQSFCITAYTILITNPGTRADADYQITALRLGLPILGIICSVAVGISVLAASAVAKPLADERARLSKYINERVNTRIPLVGVSHEWRDSKIRWTNNGGALPKLLPSVLALFWLVLLVLTFRTLIKH